ncbi:MAG: 3-dehydroquinate synthase [Firmicutes bacterium]|nr:3-dehydroquinate synthase [Bacillota bacterium]MBV1727241.1 3-dehydroquinate synthase [Desulforudis sp.]MBU4532114.1 3-dehydroquinate synthase [Bacillota bacterium]MBU4553881.1 3-dehydroquinate synthase [Bacillota bacterium]MBV1736119.1 3-dehydroquinate synthase [Desulforudis sp.]
MRQLTVGLGKRSYPILVGPGLLAQAGARIAEAVSGRLLVVSNPVVSAIYREQFSQSLIDAGLGFAWVKIPDGESLKNLDTVAFLYDHAFEAGLDRSSAVVALGGGVVGDISGFVAATYMRGIAFVQVPTTLLAQVDSSVGGKVGVNHPRGKNVIGAFHQPRLVLADISTLQSLPPREVAAGLAEVIKCAVIRDGSFFAWLEENLEAILRLDEQALGHLVEVCCRIKASVVEEDENESAKGVRQLLNYGHTMGHALESLTGYGVFRHGEAVAVGMVLSARAAQRLGYLDAQDVERIKSLLERAGLPVTLSAELGRSSLEAAIAHDKKARGGRINFIVPRAIGQASIYPATPTEVLDLVL